MEEKLWWRVARWSFLCVVSFVVSYYLWGWLGCSIMVMIGLHELGHIATAKYFGYKTGGFVFIPALGGVVTIKEPVLNLWHAFWIWFAGPLSGLLQIIVLIIVNFLFLHSQFAAAVAVVWAIINLFNLLPVIPLDGGQMVWAIGNSVNKNYGWKWYYIILHSIGLSVILYVNLIMGALVAYFGYQAISFQKSILPLNIPMTIRQNIRAIVSYTLLVIGLVGTIFVATNSFH